MDFPLAKDRKERRFEGRKKSFKNKVLKRDGKKRK